MDFFCVDCLEDKGFFVFILLFFIFFVWIVFYDDVLFLSEMSSYLVNVFIYFIKRGLYVERLLRLWVILFIVENG